jgi:hypothetical protein
MEEHLAEGFLWSVGLLRVRDEGLLLCEGLSRDVGLLLCQGLPRGAGLLRDGGSALDFLDLTVLFTGLVFLYLPIIWKIITRSGRFASSMGFGQ